MVASNSFLYRLALWLLWGLYACSLALAFFFPLYLDEFNTQLLSNRSIIDGGWSITLFPACVSSFQTRPPLIWDLVLAPSSVVHAASDWPGIVRLLGIFKALLIVSLTYLVAAAVGRDRVQGDMVKLLVLAALSLGVFPYMLVINRPEQELLIGTAGLVLVALNSVTKISHKRPQLLYISTVLFLSVYMLSAHPKAVIMFPLVMSVMVFSVRQRVLRCLLGIAVTLLFAQAYYYYASKFTCPEIAEYQRYLESWALSMPRSIADLPEFYSSLSWNLRDAIRTAVQSLFAKNYPFNWLPKETAVPDWISLVSNALVLLSFGFIAVVVGGVMIVDSRRALEDSDYRPKYILAAILVVSVVGLGVIQAEKLFYYFTLAYPMVILSAACICNTMLQRHPAFFSVGVFVVLAAAILSGITRIAMIATFLLSGYASANAPAELAPRRVPPILPLDSNVTQIEVREMAERCGVSVDGSAKRVLVDLRTYWGLRNTYQPVHVGGFPAFFYGPDSDDAVELARVLGSDGAVLHKNSIPGTMKRTMHCYGDLCCHPTFHK